MNEEIYEVERDEYVGVVDTIKPSSRHVETVKEEDKTIVTITNPKNGLLYCKRIIPANQEEPEKFYVFELPEGDDWRPPKSRLKLTLETPEEVKAFIEILNKVQKKKDND